jgi:starch synthase
MASDKSMHIVMLAAECAPYVKVGGLGDVVGALPKALVKLGVKVTVVIPAYSKVHSGAFNIKPCRSIPGFGIPMQSDIEKAVLYQTKIDGTDIDLFLIGSEKYFDRPGTYDDPVTKEGYPDNMQRFVFFMKAALELLSRLNLPVDVVHCHDSHTALIPGLLRTVHARNPFFAGVRTLLTIHNIAYQGISSEDALDYAGIDARHFYPLSPFEFWGKVNFLKTGIELADKINTVSKTYAQEIRTDPELGMGLEGVLQRRSRDFSGIINGIDYAEWNPETDPRIPARYSVRDLSGKAECKKNVLQHFGLPPLRSRVPLIGIVSRLADQKGFDLIEEAIREIAGLDLQLVVLGTGQKKYQDLFQRIAAGYPDKIAAQFSFDNQLAHRIEAGCDLFLMPSKFEPCGLNQLYSFRYGTIPIVRATGGLADTVIPYKETTGSGFSFDRYAAAEMMAAIKQALAVYQDPDRWVALIKRVMSQDWSWDKSAAQYVQLYRSIPKNSAEG